MLELFKRLPTPRPLWKSALYVFGIGAFLLCANFLTDNWDIIFSRLIVYGAPRADFSCVMDKEWWDNKDYTFIPYLYNKDCPPLVWDENARRNEGFSVFIQLPMHDYLHSKVKDSLSSGIRINFPTKYIDGKHLPDFISKDVAVDQNSIRLDYMAEDGKIIEPLEKKTMQSRRSDGQSRGIDFEEEYAPDKMTAHMKAHASFKAVVNGEHIDVDKYFPVELAVEYNYWQSFVASVKFGTLRDLIKIDLGIPVSSDHKA